GEIFDRRRVGEAETEVVGGEHPVAVGEGWDEVAEHERTGREPVQEDDDGCVRRSGVPVEQLVVADAGVSVVNVRHRTHPLDSFVPVLAEVRALSYTLLWSGVGRARGWHRSSPGVVMVGAPVWFRRRAGCSGNSP